MTRTIPTLLGRVPGDDTAEVRTDRLSLVKHAFIVAVGRDLGEAAPHDATFVTLELVSGTNLAAGKSIGIVRCHVQIFVQKINRGD